MELFVKVVPLFVAGIVLFYWGVRRDLGRAK